MNFIACRTGDMLFNIVKPGQSVTGDSAILHDYKEAGLYGTRGGACWDKFKYCIYTAHEMMVMIRTVRRAL